eukprot:TRINITY_DN1218_c1_g2_i3.p1 TRINITY_DN1218_c1_g2~~TRINITY_DN1218_c1_g2_i3.p1  ORF type:complete len:245 (-),score=62.04 TRINITY_DN1218_c1_g2_i3:240-974(-)
MLSVFKSSLLLSTSNDDERLWEITVYYLNRFKQASELFDKLKLLELFIPSIVQLSNHRNWRVREAIINSLPNLAQVLEPEEFSKKYGDHPSLTSLCLNMLNDCVQVVRFSAINCLVQLTKLLGIDWCKSNFLPEISEMCKHPNYLYRVVPLHFFQQLASSSLITSDMLSVVLPTIMSVLTEMKSDRIPNIRLNIVKTLVIMNKQCKKGNNQLTKIKNNEILPLLSSFNQDEDNDVKFVVNNPEL